MNNLDLVILKTLISNKKYALDFVNEQDAKLFSADFWNFANIVCGYIKSFKELPTLRVLVDRLSKGSNEKLIEYLSKTWDIVDKVEYDCNEYKYDLEKLKKRFAVKQITSVKEYLDKVDPDSLDISKAISEFKKTIHSVDAINNIKTYEIKNIKDYVPQFVEKFNAKRENPDLETGLLTKYRFLDFATNSLKNGDYILICGESGFGKSLLLQNIGIQCWLQDNEPTVADNFSMHKNIAYFSLEMPYEDCFNRLLSRLSGVPSRNIENCKLHKEDFIKVKRALDFVNKYPGHFKIIDLVDANANDIDTILNNCDEKFDAVFIDYLGIMKSNNGKEESDWLAQGAISYEIRAIARKYKIPVFSAVQLNRKKNAKDSDENIGLNRLARSASIATHATHVLQIESRSKEELYCEMNIQIIKNRKGPKIKGVLIKNLACATLINKPSDAEENNLEEYFINKDEDDISEEMEKLELNGL